MDWQLTRYCSPAFDLLYNIFSGTDKKLRDEHFDTLLETYYSMLSSTVRKLGSDPEKLFKFDDLHSELRRFGEFALLTGPVLIKVRLADAENMQNIDDYTERVGNGESTDLFEKFEGRLKSIYSEQVNDVISDLFAYGLVRSK